MLIRALALLEYQTDEDPFVIQDPVAGNIVIFSSHDGYSYGLNATRWQFILAHLYWISATTPLVLPRYTKVVMGSTNGNLTALDPHNGDILWQFYAGAPILTSPSLSEDGLTIFFGEAIEAIAVRSSDGIELWRTQLEGLRPGRPISGSCWKQGIVSIPTENHNFSYLLREGDDVMDEHIMVVRFNCSGRLVRRLGRRTISDPELSESKSIEENLLCIEYLNRSISWNCPRSVYLWQQ